MIETTVLNHLLSENLSVGSDVYLEVPGKPTDRYILLEKTGSGEADGLDRATFAVQSVAGTSLADAADLNEEVKTAMKDLVREDTVYSCRLNSDYNFTNTETKEYRYQAVFDIYYQE